MSQAKEKNEASPTAWAIYLAFTRIGAFLLGGGYAMLPLLDTEIVRRRHWAKEEEMADYFALAQLLPGVIAINTAMLVGNRLRGLAGNVAAALGTVTFPFLFIAAYAIAYDRVKDYPAVMSVMAGARPAVAGMILGMGLTMMLRSSAKTRLGLLLALSTFTLVLFVPVPVILIIGLGIVAGLVWNGVALIRRHTP